MTISGKIMTTLTTITKQRIIIAKDIIKNINSEKYKIIPDDDCCFADLIMPKRYNDENFKNLEEFVKVSRYCNVCPNGAILFSISNKIRSIDFDSLFNEGYGGTPFSIWSSSFTTEILNDFFDNKQLDLIEVAGAKRVIMSPSKLSKKEEDKAIIFGGKYKNANKRMIAIMRNLIKNKGKFIL